MLRKKAIRKLLITFILIYTIITTSSIPKLTNKKNEIQTNLEINDITNINTDTIYLINNKNFLVKKVLIIQSKKI